MINFNKIINRKGTYSTQWDFIQDRFGRGDLLPFTISDMDIPIPEVLQEALLNRVEHGIFGYTRWNHEPYKNAIINWYKNSFNCSINEAWIGYAPSVIYAVVKFLELYNPQHKPVAFTTPCYDGFIKILNANNFPVLTVHQEIQGEEYLLDWNLLETTISQSGVFLLCNPNNPNGYLWSKNDLTMLIKICKKYNVPIVSDDIHMDFVYEPNIFTPIIKIAEELDYLEKVIIISSASKTFNISGLGGAYIICPNHKLLEKYLHILKEKDSLSSAMILNILATIVGYNQCQPWVQDLKQYLYQNLIFVDQYLKDHIPTIKFSIPKSTYFAWLDCSHLGLNSTELQQQLINKGKVAIMNGQVYQENKVFLRFNIACPISKVEDGLNRLVLSLK